MSRNYGNYEDGSMPGKTPTSLAMGSQLIVIDPSRALDPYEKMAFRQLVDTIIDCYMIARGRWRHFRCSEWHDKMDASRIYESACERVIDWINSDRFAFYLKHFGYQSCARARVMLCEVLNGEHKTAIEQLMDAPPNPAGTTGPGGFTYNKG